MQSFAYQKKLAAAALAVTAGLTAAGCGSSSSKTSSPTTATSSASTAAPANSASDSSGGSSSNGSSSASSSSGSSSGGSSSGGGSGLCGQLSNFSSTFASNLAGLGQGSSAASEEKAAAKSFQNLAASAPAGIKQPLTNIANFFTQVSNDLSSGNVNALSGLGSQEAQLQGDAQQIATYISSNCT